MKSTRGDDAVGQMIGLVILVTGVLLLVLLFAVGGALQAGFRIYRDHGFSGGLTARILWIALATLLAICGLAGSLAAAVPSMGIGAAYVAAWSFGIFATLVAGVDWWTRKSAAESDAQLGQLDTYLDFTSLSGQRGGNPDVSLQPRATSKAGSI